MPVIGISKEICRSEKINALSDFQFRVLVGLMTYVDENGIGDARSKVIKGMVFPLRDRINNEVADIVMRSWAAAQGGDRSYRLTPATGVRFAFYNEKGADYIIVYDWDWNVVFDSGEAQHDTP